MLLVVAGCTSETPGQASSATVEEPGSSAVAGTSAAEGEPSFEDELASVLPCEVLDDDQVANLGFDPFTADFDDAGILNVCQYTVGPVETPLMSINIGVDQPLDELNLTNFNAIDHQVGPLRALLITDDRDPNKCQISMELGENAHATVRVMFTDSREAACEAVERLAAAVEPELPRETP
ncbi:DUF3558 domain-containing protein [Actinoalloteichus sp. AHMU CJ021]|uniref:DUF3558 domain-containing protein n=1 Tax=Actinoalloteichus TaxID=65496 RepID=UPI0009DD4FD7|nr:DUF3558 domain-containing protein [Actinoalloteichus caeruleus]AUS78017.1 DUF3558 domain-containing protein [Actinoalloteichus sp. AHMU CJ021]